MVKVSCVSTACSCIVLNSPVSLDEKNLLLDGLNQRIVPLLGICDYPYIMRTSEYE